MKKKEPTIREVVDAFRELYGPAATRAMAFSRVGDPMARRNKAMNRVTQDSLDAYDALFFNSHGRSPHTLWVSEALMRDRGRLFLETRDSTALAWRGRPVRVDRNLDGFGFRFE